MNKKQIENLYLEQGFGIKKISKITGHSPHTIRKYLHIWKIPKHLPSQKTYNNCLSCGSCTFNPKFCSRSCASTFNNKYHPKKKKKPCYCVVCGSETTIRRKYCNNCRNRDMTLKEAIYTMHHQSSAFALVRTRARAIAKKLGWIECIHCGYNKHTEIGHRKPIAEFPKHTLISEINTVKNLIPLCPNCHWEFDHGLLKL